MRLDELAAKARRAHREGRRFAAIQRQPVPQPLDHRAAELEADLRGSLLFDVKPAIMHSMKSTTPQEATTVNTDSPTIYFEEISSGAHYEIIGDNGCIGEVQCWEDYEGESREVTMLVKDLNDSSRYRSIR